MRHAGGVVWVAGAAVLALAACVSLKPAGQGVRLTANPELVKGCTYIGDVKGTSLRGVHGPPEIDEQSAYNDLRNHAGEMGADTVLLWSTPGAGGPVVRGEAYRCAGARPEPTRSPS